RSKRDWSSDVCSSDLMAMVLGIPFGRMIGEAYGWRNSFALIAIVASVVCLLLAKTLPLLPSVNSGSLSSLKTLLKRPSLMLVFRSEERRVGKDYESGC